MIYTAPSSTEQVYIEGLATGLTGTLQFKLIAVDGTVAIAATTSGISEVASGRYKAVFTTPATPGDYIPQWIKGPTTYDDNEFLRVGGVAPAVGAAYATVSHVEALTPNLPYSATSKPSDTQVIGYLSETAAEIDGILTQQGYTIPVPTTATSALTFLQKLNAQGAWALAMRAVPGSPHVDRAEKVWDDALAMLRDGLIEPVGLGRDVTVLHARMPSVATPWFCRDMDW